VTPNADGQKISASTILESLSRAVEKELERKRRLGHYYVTYENGAARYHDDDSPCQKKPVETPVGTLGSDPRTFGGVKCTGVHPTQLLDSPSTFRYTPSELTD